MVAWGSWSNCLKFTEGFIRFEVFYIEFSFSVFALSLLAAFTLGMAPGDGDAPKYTYLDDFRGKTWEQYLCAIGAGLVFNIANLMLCKGIGLLGIAVAFPLCIGTALVLGTLVTYAVQSKGDFALLIVGVIIAFAAVCLASVVQTLKDRQLAARSLKAQDPEIQASRADQSGGLLPGACSGSNNGDEAAGLPASVGEATENGPSLQRKLAICIVGGILMGCWNPLVTIAEDKDRNGEPGLSAYGELTFYTFAVAVSSLFLIPVVLRFPLEGGPSTPLGLVCAEMRDVPPKAHFWSLLAGVIWCVGTLANAVGGSSKDRSGNLFLSSAASYAIGQCANMVAILWGALYFKEFSGTDWVVKLLLAAVCMLYLGAIACIALSSS